MINILILLGKTASGKDKTVNKLVNEYNFKKIITYTTRPMRKDEIQDVTYHYISEDDFKNKISEGFFAEWKTYVTKFGEWYYGTALKDMEKADDKSVIILTPDGYKDVIEQLSTKHKSIYIYANNTTIKKRLIERGDNSREAQRRLEQDNVDFKGIENKVNKIVYNNDGANIEDVIGKILEFLEDNN